MTNSSLQNTRVLNVLPIRKKIFAELFVTFFCVTVVPLESMSNSGEKKIVTRRYAQKLPDGGVAFLPHHPNSVSTLVFCR